MFLQNFYFTNFSFVYKQKNNERVFLQPKPVPKPSEPSVGFFSVKRAGGNAFGKGSGHTLLGIFRMLLLQKWEYSSQLQVYMA